jgi:YVTN family beta-propeller protein
MVMLRFNLLGPLEVRRGGTAIELGPRKQRAVLALLLLSANRVVPTERLIDDLWGDSPPETARSALQVYVAGLRKALADDGDLLRTVAPGYVLELRRASLDLDRFNALRAEARATTDAARRAELLHGALDLWRGPPLAELGSEPFVQAAAAQLDELRRATLEERIDADLELGRHAVVISELDRLVEEHPYHEPFRRQLMLALYRAGRQADALATYRDARETFSEALGMEPGPELKALERAVLEQDRALGAPLPPGSVEAPKRRALAAAAAVVVVALVAAVGALLLLRDDSSVAVPPNSVAIVDPETHRVTGVVPVGVRPGPLAAGGGAVWAGNLDDKTLTRIAPGSRTAVETISLGATPTGVAFGGGAVWVAQGLTGTVVRVEPKLGGVTSFPAAQTAMRSISGAVAYGDDAVWTVFGDATFGRIDPRSGRFEWLFAGSRPSAVVEGGGAVWVVSSADSTVYRFSPATFLDGPIGRASVGRRSTAIAYGHGAVWVASQSDDVVTRIDPGTSATVQIPVGDRPVAVAVGADAVWVANAGDASVSRVDPDTGEVVATVEIGSAPAGIAVGYGSVWVATQAP